MSEDIPKEDRAYALIILNPSFIAGLDYIPPSTRKVYYDGIAFKVPPYRNIEDVAREIAEGATNPEALDCKVIHRFTATLDESTLDFRYDEVHERAERLGLELGIKILVQPLNKEWLPF